MLPKEMIDDLVIGEGSWASSKGGKLFVIPIMSKDHGCVILHVINPEREFGMELAEGFLSLLRRGIELEDHVKGLQDILAGMLEPCAN